MSQNLNRKTSANSTKFNALEGVNILSQAPPVKFNNDDNHDEASVSDGGLANGVMEVPPEIVSSWTARTRGEFDLTNSLQEDGVLYLNGDGEVLHPDNATQDSFKVAYTDPSEEVVEDWYNNLSKQAIWFGNHDMLDEQNIDVSKFEDSVQGYREANQLLADRAFGKGSDSGKYWVHDFQLFNAPKMIREKDSEADIIYTHHTPVARNTEEYGAIPGIQEMTKDLTASDAGTFHREDDITNLEALVEEFGEQEGWDYEIGEENGLRYVDVEDQGRMYLKRTPIGTDKEHYSDVNQELVEEMREEFDSDFVASTFLRLDPTKNGPGTIRAFKQAKEEYDDFPNDAKFIIKGRGTGSGIDVFDRENSAVQHMADAYVDDWRDIGDLDDDTDVVFTDYFFSEEELKAMYGASDMPLATSKRDGYNLVATEGIISNANAANDKHAGISLISDDMGATDVVEDYVLTADGYNINEMAEQMHEAYQMSNSDRRKNMRRAENDIPDTNDWAKDINDLMADVQ